MDDWYIINARICMLWSQILSFCVGICTVFAVCVTLLKFSKFSKMSRLNHPNRSMFQRDFITGVLMAIIIYSAYLAILLLPRAVTYMYYLD